MQADQTVAHDVDPDTEKPQNGLKGLKHWRQDILAGLVVALVSVPLSLGIALASGAPPICGIWSEVIAGLVIPFFSGAYVAISGPAAGLAPALYTGIFTLGRGDMDKGYHLITGVILLVGILQLVLTWLKAARFSYLFPNAAIQGMLSAIGFLIIAKQIPNFIGHGFQAHEFWKIVFEAPSEVVHLHPQVFAISAISLAFLFIIPKLKVRYISLIPPQLIVVAIATILGCVWHLDEKFLVNVPDNPLKNGIVPPDFQALFSDPSLVGSIIVIVLTLTFIDGTESLATIFAVDKIDPWHRKSNPNRTLFAMGISNMCSSLIGGLTIIPGIIKSTTNIHSGGRTSWANFYNAIFLIIFLLAANNVIHLIPLGALAAVLVHIGWKLAGPHKWRMMWSIGSEQMLIYIVTILVTVSSDLMIGILAGILLKFLFLIYYNSKAAHPVNMSVVTSLFSNPVLVLQESQGATILELGGPIVCFNSLHLRAACEKAFERRVPIKMKILSSVNVVDHSTSTYLQSFQQECQRAGIDCSLDGLDGLKARTAEQHSLKYRPAPLPVSIEGTQLLLVIDDSEHSNTAVEEVIRSPWPKGSQIVIATVMTVPFGLTVSEQHTQKANQLVSKVADQIRTDNKTFEQVESIVVQGDPKTQICALLQKYHSDLLVTGTRNHSGISRALSSLSHALLLAAHCSVRICRSKRSKTGTKVMVALDDSKFSANALEQVANRPWPEATEFLCISAVPTLAESSYEFQDTYAITDLEQKRREQVESAKALLDAATEYLNSQLPDCTAKSKIIDGDPREVLIKLAEEESADLIVLGSAGKNFAERFVVGSVSETVAVCASCSVEVVGQLVRRRSQFETVPRTSLKPVASSDTSVG